MDIVERLKQEFSGNALKDIADQTRAYVKERHEAADEIERLREDKAELLKALTNLYEACRWEKVCPTIDAAKDAIAKATGDE